MTTIGNLSEELGLSVQNVRTALSHLVSTQEVTIRKALKTSIISIKNWEDYQETNKTSTECQQDDNNESTTFQQSDNNELTESLSLYREEGKEDKEVKNDKKEKKEKNGAAPSSPSEAEIKDYVDKMGYTFSAENFFDYYERQNWTSRGQPIKDWRKLMENFGVASLLFFILVCSDLKTIFWQRVKFGFVRTNTNQLAAGEFRNCQLSIVNCQLK